MYGCACDHGSFVVFVLLLVDIKRRYKVELAEWESRDMHRVAFDASYAWTWWDALHDVSKGKRDATGLYTYYAWGQKFYPRQAYRLLYTTNHDKNTWDGTEFDSSWGGTPFQTTIGAGMVIAGWDQGLVGKTVGSQVLLVIPADLGYGAAGSGSIPGGATLVFVVDVLAAG